MTIMNPRGMSVDISGNFYITDSDTHRLYKFSNTGTLKKSKGGCGKCLGELHNPKGVVVIEEHVLVCDLFNRRIQFFKKDDLTPEFIVRIPQKYLCPFHIAYSAKNKLLYITGTNIIYICEMKDNLKEGDSLKVMCWIKKYKEGNETHKLQRIGEIAVEEKRLIITETFQNSVLVLDVQLPTHCTCENVPVLVDRSCGAYSQEDESPEEDMVTEFKIQCPVATQAPSKNPPEPDDLKKPHPVVVHNGFIFVSDDYTTKSFFSIKIFFCYRKVR